KRNDKIAVEYRYRHIVHCVPPSHYTRKGYVVYGWQSGDVGFVFLPVVQSESSEVGKGCKHIYAGSIMYFLKKASGLRAILMMRMVGESLSEYKFAYTNPFASACRANACTMYSKILGTS